MRSRRDLHCDCNAQRQLAERAPAHLVALIDALLTPDKAARLGSDGGSTQVASHGYFEPVLWENMLTSQAASPLEAKAHEQLAQRIEEVERLEADLVGLLLEAHAVEPGAAAAPPPPEDVARWFEGFENNV